jgi:hypothetical protein
MQFGPTLNKKGDGLDFRSESEVCQIPYPSNSFGNNINPYYHDEREIKIPTKVFGKSYDADMVRACIGLGTI